MFLLRAVRAGDLRDLLVLARHLDSCNLPNNRLLLQQLIKQSLLSFHGKVTKKEHRRFLFVAENQRTGRVVGCSLIAGRHGTPKLPQLAFKISRETKRSRILQKSVQHTTLQLTQDKVGRTEIGGLVVLPRYRKHRERIGTQLSLVRFGFMAVHRSWFCKRLLVEYMPSGDSLKGNALWQGVGKEFLHLDYHRADRLSAKNKEFMLSLLPKEKIYCTLFSQEAQKAVGTPGPGGKVSLGILKKLGFKFLEQVDPFDGGPYYGAAFEKISLIKRTRKRHFTSLGTPYLPQGLKALVLYEKGEEVRGCVSTYKIQKGKVNLPEETKKILNLEDNDLVIFTSLKGML